MSSRARELITDELIAAVEAATEGSRELDARIWHTIPREPPDCSAIMARVFALILAGEDDAECPHYTTSLDAALTLVLEQFDWSILHLRNGNRGAEAVVFTIGMDIDHIEVEGATPALALCAAALRARKAMEGQE